MPKPGLSGVVLIAGIYAAGWQVAAQTPSQGKTFRARTDFVSTTVVVRDDRGRFVPGLTRDDFEVLEDGVPQTISEFSAAVGGRVLPDAIAKSEKPASGLILPDARARTNTSARVFIIFIDDLHLQPADSPRVRALLALIRDRLVHEGDLIAYVSTGYSAIESTLSYDYKFKRFNEAIGKVIGSAPTPRDIIQSAQSSEGPVGLRHNVHVAFSTAYHLLDQLATWNDRRKAFIYVSSGYDLNPFKDARFKAAQETYERPLRDGGAERSADAPMRPFGNPFDRSGQFSEADLINQLVELTRAARQANVTFYAMDPRGLTAGPDISESLSASEWRDHVRTSLDSLEALGSETGGFCICNQNDFTKGLERIDNEMSDHYVIGYVSTNPDPTRVRRRIEIRVRRPNVRATYLEYYRIDRSGGR